MPEAPSHSEKQLRKKLNGVSTKLETLATHVNRCLREGKKIKWEVAEELFFSLVRLDRQIELRNEELFGPEPEEGLDPAATESYP